MTEMFAGEGYALGLLVDLRALCRKIDSNNYRMAAELHDRLRKVASPNVRHADKELTLRVQQKALDECGETLRFISLEGDMEVARATFRVAVRCYPRVRWLLLWGSYIVEKYEPKGES